ncbi:hypothetical protein L5B97_06670 [Avibacterium sp. 20-15]|uniref:hypothetical protein n=1 Tax=unclassified Avibacterium TaxID=2685287 RepID=UPI002025BE6F|nr:MULTISPECIES: hypothetical protein [unclassified Avibacterium]MCW9733167.1 hypothetical protein [Avibacterium sp. 20-15]URL05286.1 hypothetical protein L4F93_05360 [Avibacterium sp. 20-132]
MNANTKNKTRQFDVLESDIQALHQPITLLNILASRTDIEALEHCEIQDALQGIESLLYAKLEIIEDRIAMLKGGSND